MYSYIIGYVIIYNGGYQDRDEVVSAVTTKVTDTSNMEISDAGKFQNRN